MLDSAELCRLFGCVRTDTQVSVHDLARERICETSEELGYYSIPEYEIPDLVTEGRTSYIDVVWLSGSVVAFAFEIKTKKNDLDVVTTRKDTKKLYFLNAQKRFIVNVSPFSGKAYFNKLLDAGFLA